MSAPVVLGLTGKKRSGKDTVADFLVKDHGYVKIAFADALRECMAALNPVVFYGERGWVRYNQIIEEVGYDRAKEEYPEVRRLLQVFGTEVVRDLIGPETWVKIAERKFYEADRPVVVTDVRFPNEWRHISNVWGGQIVRVIRPSLGDHTDNHPSEISVDGPEFTPQHILYNEGPLDRLRLGTDSLARHVFKQYEENF